MTKSSSRRRILLSTVGLVPQVLTETLYALVQDRTAPFIPDEIHVITTSEGRDRTRLALLDPSRALLARFAEEFEVPAVAHALTLDRIHVIADDDGHQLNDITTEAGNAAAADLITHLVRQMTADPTSELHVSLAGGRKTMGFLLGMALSLFGREQDGMSHVLVEPQAFETNPEFFYPPRVPVILQDPRDRNRPVDTRDARIALAPIPFIRLRDRLPRHLLEGTWSYSETIKRAQSVARPPKLIVDWKNARLSCGGIVVPLSPVLFAYYAWLAERRMRQGDDAAVHHLDVDPTELQNAYRYAPGIPEEFRAKLLKDISRGEPLDKKMEQRKSRVNIALTSALGLDDTAYHIGSVDYLPGTKLKKQMLFIPPDAISFGDVPLPIEDE